MTENITNNNNANTWLYDYCGSNEIFFKETDLLDNSTTLLKQFNLLPSCFSHLVIPLLQLSAILLVYPLICYCLTKYKSKNYTIPRRDSISLLYIIKLVINICLILLWILQWVNLTILTNPELPAEKVTPWLYVVSYILSLGLEWYTHNCDQKRNGFLFIFWLLASISACYVLLLETTIGNSQETVSMDLNNAPIMWVNLALVVSMLISQYFGEPTDLPDKTCPEYYVSWPNTITFWWLNKIMILGYEKTLEEEDLWDLNDCDKSKNAAVNFQKLSLSIRINRRNLRNHLTRNLLYNSRSRIIIISMRIIIIITCHIQTG